jgi:dTDP-4-dehydrorhamnose reductase
MRIVVTGAGGMLGSAFVRVAHRVSHEVIPVYRTRPDHLPPGIELDLGHPQAATMLVRQNPDLIVNCAALTDVDWCETHQSETIRINAEAPGFIAQSAAQNGTPMVQISTDSVFDGRRGGYSESDSPNPLNAYAAAKLAGEDAVLSASDKHLVVRTNIFGRTPRSLPRRGLVEWIIGSLERGETVAGFIDARFSPLWVEDLSSFLLQMASRRLQGLYHLGSEGTVTKFEFARLVATAFGFDPGLVSQSSVHDARFLAARPRDTSLDSRRIARLLGRLPDVSMAVHRLSNRSLENSVEGST